PTVSPEPHERGGPAARIRRPASSSQEPATMQDYVYLKVEGSKGAVKGESQDTRHEGEIDLLSWSWGMRSPRDLATRGASGRVAYGDLVVEKQIDAASTGLMTLLATNDEIRKAVVSV